MKILDGNKISKELLETYKTDDITLAIIKSKESSSENYIKSIIKTCEKANINVIVYEEEIYKITNLIEKLNDDDSITGIIITHDIIHFDELVKKIKKEKDAEGLTRDNIYNLYIGKENIIPCTVKGILKLLNYYEIDLEGKDVTIIGRSLIAGRPLALAISNRNATVTICHSKTKNLKDYTKKADIIISLAGIPKLIKKEMVKEGFIGIDVGISNVEGQLIGDFDFDEVKEKASYLSKVKGGTGPMTITMLIDNLIKLKKMQEK